MQLKEALDNSDKNSPIESALAVLWDQIEMQNNTIQTLLVNNEVQSNQITLLTNKVAHVQQQSDNELKTLECEVQFINKEVLVMGKGYLKVCSKPGKSGLFTVRENGRVYAVSEAQLRTLRKCV